MYDASRIPECWNFLPLLYKGPWKREKSQLKLPKRPILRYGITSCKVSNHIHVPPTIPPAALKDEIDWKEIQKTKIDDDKRNDYVISNTVKSAELMQLPWASSIYPHKRWERIPT